ncbi:MAG TPA: acyl-CoA thioesterase [Bacilli bacterium]|nr:acyl-CoA thioesterase [Bacilli bacterium]
MNIVNYIQPNEEEWIASFKFFTPINPRICETDLYGHINNTSYLVYFEEGRIEYFKKLDVFGTHFSGVTGDIYCRYHSEAFALEELEIGVRTTNIGTKSFMLEYCLVRKEDKKLIASGWGTIVAINSKTKKTETIPEIMRARICELEQREF